MVEQSSALTLAKAARWRGPNGYTLLAYDVDFGDGGGSRLRVRSPEGRDYWVDGVDLEIVEPGRIVFTGNVELGGERPVETTGTVTFRRT